MADLFDLQLRVDSRDVNRGAADMDRFTSSTTRASKSVDVMEKSMASLKRSIAGFVGGFSLGIILEQATKQAIAFNQAMGQVSTNLDDTSGLEAQGKALRALAKEFGSDATTQAEAYYEALSSGATAGAEALEQVTVANKLAVGGITTTTVAIDGLTSVLNAYKGEGIKAGEISDNLFVTMRAGKTNIEELSNSLGMVAPTAASVGVKFDELTSAIAAITLAGVNTKNTVTQVNAALAALIKPSQEATELAAQLGINFSVAGLQSKGFAGFMEEVRVKTGGSQEAIATLFGSIEATRAVLSLTGPQAGAFADILEQMGRKAGETDKAFQKLAETDAAKIARGQAVLRDLLISLGNALNTVTIPAVEAFTEAFKDVEQEDVEEFLNDMIDVIEVLATVITARLVASIYASGTAFVVGTAEAIRYQTALATMAGVSGRAAIGLTALGGASRLAAGAMALVGGPVGVAVLAGAGLVYLATRESEAQRETRELKDRLGELRGELGSLSEAALNVRLDNVRAQLRDVQDLIDENKIKIDEAAEDARRVAGLSRGGADRGGGAMRMTSVANGRLAAEQEELLKQQSALMTSENELLNQRAKLTTTTEAATTAATGNAGATGVNAEAAAKLAEQQQKLNEQTAAYNEQMRNQSLNQRQQQIELETIINLMATGLTYTEAMKEAKFLLATEEERVTLALQEQVDAAQKAEEKTKAATEALKGLDDLNIGADFAAGFDQASQSLGSFVRSFSGLVDIEKARQNDIVKAGADQKKIAEANSKALKMQISTYGDLAGAAKGFFDEGTTGYKVLGAAEKAFRAMEIALALESLAVKLVSEETAAAAHGGSVILYVAGEMAKATASGIAAIASSMVGLPFPLNLAAMAATIAALAGIGILISGGGGGGGGTKPPESPIKTSGTVLGDPEAASASVVSSIEILTDVQEKGLDISEGMLTALKNIERLQAGLASEFAQLSTRAGTQGFSVNGTLGDVSARGGDLLPRFIRNMLGLQNTSDLIAAAEAGTLKRPRDSGIAGAAANDYIDRVLANPDEFGGVNFSSTFQAIFDNMGDAIRSAVETFGGDADAAVALFESFPIAEMFREQDDVGAAIEAWVSSIGDSAMDAVMAGLGFDLREFQQIGEGATETLTRLVTEYTILNDVIDVFGMSTTKATGRLQLSFNQLSNGMMGVTASWERAELTPQEMIAIADDLANRAGGVEKFADNMAELMDVALTDSQKWDRLKDQLGDLLTPFGLAIPTTKEELQALIGGIDLTTESGRELLTALSEANPALASFIDGMQEIRDTALDARIALGLVNPDTRAIDTFSQQGFDWSLFVDAAREGLEPLQEMFAGMTDEQLTALAPFIDRLLEFVPAADAATGGMDAVTQSMLDAAYATQVALGLADGLDPLRAMLTSLGLSVDAVFGAASQGTVALMNYFRSLNLSTEALAALQPVIAGLIALARDADAAAKPAAQSTRDYSRAVYDVPRAVSSATKGIKKETEGLEDELLKLIDARAEIMKRERAELHASNYARYDALQALKKQKELTDDLVDSYEDAAAGLRDFAKSLRETMQDVSGAALSEVRTSFDALAASAIGGNVAAMQAIPEAGRRLVALSEKEASSRFEFQRDIARAMVAAEEAALVADNEITIAKRSYDQLVEQTLLLFGIKGTLDQLRGTVPGFAEGGDHLGGWRMVGEDGPELEYTGPSRIYSNRMLNAAMGSGSDMLRVEARLAAVEMRLAESNQIARDGHFATAKYTLRSAKKLEEWDNRGMPPERVDD